MHTLKTSENGRSFDIWVKLIWFFIFYFRVKLSLKVDLKNYFSIIFPSNFYQQLNFLSTKCRANLIEFNEKINIFIV